jgi:hypothetical protein
LGGSVRFGQGLEFEGVLRVLGLGLKQTNRQASNPLGFGTESRCGALRLGDKPPLGLLPNRGAEHLYSAEKPIACPEWVSDVAKPLTLCSQLGNGAQMPVSPAT